MARWLRSVSLLALISLAACGGGGGSPTSSTTFIPDLQNLWQDTRDQAHVFSFNVAQPGQASSNFTGEETRSNGTTSNVIAGRYVERSIQFVLERPPAGNAGDINYTGQFVNKDRIELNSSAGALTLCRALTGPCS